MESLSIKHLHLQHQTLKVFLKLKVILSIKHTAEFRIWFIAGIKQLWPTKSIIAQSLNKGVPKSNKKRLAANMLSNTLLYNQDLVEEEGTYLDYKILPYQYAVQMGNNPKN